MAIARRSPHRWWLSLVTIAWAMLATTDAFAREMPGNGGHAVAGAIAEENGSGQTTGADCAAEGPRSERGIRLGVHKHRLAIPEFGRRNDPNIDGASSDPGGGEMLDDLEDDDEKHHPVLRSLQNAGRCWIILQAESALARNDTRSAPSLSHHPLRC